MRFLKTISLLVLTAPLLFAADQSPKTKPTSAGVTPSISLEAKSKIQGLIIRQQNIQIRKKSLEDAYRELQTESEQVSKQAIEAQSAALKEAGVDEKEYQVTVSPAGEVTLTPKPKDKK